MSKNHLACLYFGSLSDNRPKINVSFAPNVSCNALIDTGATHSALSEEVFLSLVSQKLGTWQSCTSSIPTVLTDAQGGALQVKHAVEISFEMHGKQISHKLHILSNLAQKCILGIDFITKYLTVVGPTRQIHVGSDPIPWATLPALVHARTVIPANSVAKVLCQVRPPRGMKFIPGVTVLTHDSEVEGLEVIDGLCKVLDRNAVYIVVANRNHYDLHLGKASLLTRVQNSADIHGCELTDETVGRIIAGGAAAVNEICAASSQRPPLSPEKRRYLIDHINLNQVPPKWRDQYLQLILDNHDVFAANKYDLGWTDAVSHRINMRHSRPIYQRQFPIPQAHEDTIQEHVKELLKKGVIERCSSPYNTPVFAVAKKSGGLRVVQDFREINRASYEDKYSIRDVRECIDAIGKSNSDVFSTLDLASGFWQQNLEPESRPLTAFTVPSMNQQFQWCCTAMGLQGAPASFSRLTAQVFSGDEASLTYIDDVLGHTRGHARHLEWLESAFARLRQYGLKLNAKKCVFGAKDVTYLGFNVSSNGVSPEKDKVEAIKLLKPPSTVKEVKEFVGFCNYFRAMIPHFHQRAAPLFDLTKLSSPWSKGTLPSQALAAFEDLRNTLGSAPIVAYPDFQKEFVLAVDAASGSDTVRGGLGAVLSQPNGDGTENVVAYWSRGLRAHETRYTPYNLEMAAIVGAVDHFHTYLYGRKFTVLTDHKPLVGAADKNAKTFSRLNEKLQMYDCDIIYRRGGQNQGPDYLSRNAAPAPAAVEALTSSGGWLHEQRRHKPLADLEAYLVDKKLDEETKEFVLFYAAKSFIKNDTLWLLARPPPNSGLESEPVAWVPIHKVQEVIARHHGTPLAGHWATSRTVQLLSRKYYWPTMSHDVDAFIARCRECQMSDSRQPRAHLHPWEPATAPFQRVHIDLYGPLTSLREKKYVAVVTDAFTKWVEVVAIQDKTAATVAEMLFHNWVCRFGSMARLVSDGGKEFANKVLEGLLRLCETAKTVNSPYHPEANGQVERFNRDMGAYLTKMCEDTQDWEAFLPSLALAHNAAVNRSTNHSPFYLLFGRTPRLPGDLEKPTTSSESFSAELFRRLQAAHQWVMRNNAAAREAYKSYYDKKAKLRSFIAGDLVLVHFPPDPKAANKKLCKPWRGVFMVSNVLNDTNVELVKNHGDKPFTAHVNRVKHFHTLTPPAISRRLEAGGLDDNEVEIAAPSASSSDTRNAPSQQDIELYGLQYFRREKAKQAGDDTPRTSTYRAAGAEQQPLQPATDQERESGEDRDASVSNEQHDADNNEDFGTPPNSPPPLPLPQAPADPLPHLPPLQAVAQQVFRPRLTRHSGLVVTDSPWVLPKRI